MFVLRFASVLNVQLVVFCINICVVLKVETASVFGPYLFTSYKKVYME